MNEFKVNDLVTIIAQPGSSKINSHINMRGLSGYIEEIVGEYAQFVELNEKGYGGCGGVPLSCLSLQNDNRRLQELKRIKEEKFEALLKENQERQKKYTLLLENYLTRISEKTGISIDLVKEIFKAHKDFENEWDIMDGRP